MVQFVHHPLRLLNPSFDSPLLDVLTDLEHLRRLQIQGTTPMPVFMQLKQVFHVLESLASARIEGNHTTLADYVEARVIDGPNRSEQLQEIANIERAMQQVEDSVEPGEPVTEHLLRGLHATTVDGLKREGDTNPGAYRQGAVKIAQADHQPPEAPQVPDYMTELVTFINRADPPKYDLMKVALAHHRFAWVHPFGNGNGRVVRLLTYAMLIKYGFRVNAVVRLLNPAAVFCADRNAYYARLGDADAGTDEALERWCVYVLSGVRDELTKVDRLADYEHLKAKVLLPAVNYARERQLITPLEQAVLTTTIKAGTVKAGDLEAAMPDLNANQRTYQIRKLVDGGMLQPINPGARQYSIGFSHNMLLRGVVRALTDEGFIPAALVAPPV
ncbi:filamentation induced by cAMP protein Fic [Acidovorax sp. NO-1]|jgi:Fic family protein|uniref:Fic family protein n=1 Tax=Acidovorax sp. NO-1 TaxID=512030 RepID=UPI00023FC4BC|nr:Fic family protein [Acidovorax sp. NO-1]EHL23531.1 filamentation induced by cAMP protein Fic [Acidovorax sp. NO-1]MDO9202551.1 Fic family protein [Hydrogenophaga sp.]PKO64593.1 MAG: Fic family protein [Betaproteobacteria bacterium HGW-Betaproteobacteria-16]